MLAWHSVLRSYLSSFDQVHKVSLTLLKSTSDGFLWELREILILNDKIVQVVSQVVSACCTTMAIKDAKEADLGPLNIQILFALRLQNVENNGDSVLIIITNDTLISIGSVRFDNATLFLAGLRRLVIFQKESLRVEYGWIFSEKERLDLYKLNIRILGVLTRQS